MIRHRWCHLTHFCERCGTSMAAIFEGKRWQCTDADNVAAISHVRARQRFAALELQASR